VDRPNNRLLFLLVAVYAAASLVHFVHNAEFLGDYPGLPDSWSRGGVYLAWVGMTAVGALGALLVYRTREAIGLLLLAVYAALGMDSLGHYVVAPVSAHSSMMNTTILLEVGAAALVLLEVTRRLFGLVARQRATGSSRRS
jgi:predicted branched-subunit amino acid permease